MLSLYDEEIQTTDIETKQQTLETTNEDKNLLKDFKFKLNKRGYKSYDKEQVNDLIRKYRTNNDQFALIQLYKMHEPLFKSSANKYWFLQGICYESEMNYAFYQAILNYNIDNKTGACFDTYFNSCVTNRMRVIVNQEKAEKRKSNYDGLSFDDDYSDGTEKNTSFGDIVPDYKASKQFTNIEHKDIYKKAFKLLDKKQKLILQKIADGVNLKNIARELNLKNQEVKNIISDIKDNKVFLNTLKEVITMDKTTFTIIDGTNLACRALLAVNQENDLKTSTGIPTGYIYRFIKMFIQVIKETNPTHMVVCWDVDRNTWRRKLYADYKANRGDAFTREKVSFQPIKDILESIGVLNVEYNGYEGDDLCGTFANLSTANKTYVVSGDRDIFQLVKPNVDVLYINSKDHTIINEDYIKENYQINPKDFILLKTLMGDKGDNIPGITGVAEKGAVKLINKFKNLETLLEQYNNKDYCLTAKQISNIKEWKSNAKLYHNLVTIKNNVPIEYEMNDCKVELDWHNAIDLFKRYEFNSFIKNVDTLPTGGIINE